MLTPFLPHGLVLEPAPDGNFIIYEPADRSLAGHLTLPCMDGRSLAFAELHIPSNGRFTQDDLRSLWNAGAELATWRSARSAVLRENGSFGAPVVVARSNTIRDWPSLVRCAHDAAALLNGWPSVLDRRATWLPVGVPGGTEDVPQTTRDVERYGHFIERESRLEVAQSLRWVGARRSLVSGSVANLAMAVVETVRTSVSREELMLLRPILIPIGSVAERAATPDGHRDPDPSSWPMAFVSFATICLRVLAEVQSVERGRGVVPLLDTDELYEAWLAVELRGALDEALGARLTPSDGSLGAWAYEDVRYEIWVRPSVTRDGRTFGTATYRSIVAQTLTPDILLTASRDEETAVHVFDAKSWARMLPEEALAESAKYLYGLRRSSDMESVPAISGVDLVTCAWRPAISEPEMARVQVSTATPSIGLSALRARLNEVLVELAAGIEARERLASTI